MDKYIATRELLRLTVFRKGDGWGVHVEEIDDDSEGAWAPDITYPSETSAKAQAVLEVREIFGYGYTESDFQWEPV
jgi:hypothetical protein